MTRTYEGIIELLLDRLEDGTLEQIANRGGGRNKAPRLRTEKDWRDVSFLKMFKNLLYREFSQT